MRPPLPPFAVAPVAFRFPATAALAGRLPLGSGREAVLAALLAVRLAEGCTTGVVPAPARETRAAAAAQWLSASCPDARIRAACIEVVRASAQSAAADLRQTVTRLITALGPHLDAAARKELEGFANPL